MLVQLPAFNEGMLIERAIRAAAMDWPRDRLTIQVLDDSTDGSEAISRRFADELRRTGVDIQVIHRRDRAGFKAGALANGLLRDDSPYIAVFDADFVPPPDFLKRTVPVLMADKELAFVQARWEHLNAGENMLTRAQAVMLDAHFGVEQSVRFATGMILPFNGTCGVWRRDAIDDAGGWTADTLTEDLDLSVRAHLAGWRAAYLPQVTAAGELPTTLAAWRTQQHRWNKGFAQVARKLLPSVWRSDLPPLFKLALTLEVGQSLFCPLAALCLTTSLSLLWLNAGQQPLAMSAAGPDRDRHGRLLRHDLRDAGAVGPGTPAPERHPVEHPGRHDADIGPDPVQLPRGVRGGHGQAVALRPHAQDGRHGHGAGPWRAAPPPPARPASRKSSWAAACSSPWCCTKAGTPPCWAPRSWAWPWSAAPCCGNAGR